MLSSGDDIEMVALKIMDVTLIKEDYVIRNLYREAKIMTRLFHPCVAALFQTMQFGNLYYLVMEMVGGGDLCTFIKAQRNGKLDERCTRVYARQLVSAISHMHNIGIVHRDLKMENLMLNSIHTQIKIVDFGLSNTYSELNPLRTHCGSPEYAAPELFIEGKHYGPEVDLWSLGVILYGMVVGQLPFVSIKENTISSQERRKKLLEQINKGMAAPHRRALSLFSSEFKSMMSKLLVADSLRRISIKDLVFHPWITEKGRKSVRSNPLKRLDGQYQAIIMKDVGSLLQLSLNEVEFAVKSEPQGNVAGIYNILAFRQTLHQMEGDGITRILPDQVTNYLTPRLRVHSIKIETKPCDTKPSNKRKDGMKSAPVHKSGPKSTPRTPPGKLNSSAHKSPTQRNTTKTTSEEKSLKKRMIPKILLTKLDKPASAKGGTPVSDFIATPSRRLTVSADEHKRLKLSTHKLSQHQITISSAKTLERGESPKSHASHGVRRTPQMSPLLKERQAIVTSIEGNVPNAHKAALKSVDAKLSKMKASDKSFLRALAFRVQSASADNPKTDIVPPNRRPLTGPTHTAERALKRRSMLPVTTTSSAPNKGGATGTPLSAPLRLHKASVNKTSDFREKSPQVTGDAGKRLAAPSMKNQGPRPFLNEPIARSIAGYVVNNIPTKLHTFKWIKATKKDS